MEYISSYRKPKLSSAGESSQLALRALVLRDERIMGMNTPFPHRDHDDGRTTGWPELLEARPIEPSSSSDEEPPSVDEASPDSQDDTLHLAPSRVSGATVIGVADLDATPAPSEIQGEPAVPSRGDLAVERVAYDVLPQPIWRPMLFSWVKPLFGMWYALHRLREGKPPLMVAVFLGTGALVVFIAIAASVKGVLAFTTGANAPKETYAPPVPQVIELEDTPAPSIGDMPPCRVMGPAKSVAPEVQLAGGLEAVVVRGEIAAGFARTPNEAVVLPLDPSDLSSGVPQVSASKEAIRRVTPIQDGSVAISSDGKRDPMAARRPSSGPTPVDIGMAGGHLVWATHPSNEFGALWALEGDAPIDALRAVPLDGAGGAYILVFRRGASIWSGVIARADDSSKFAPVGALFEAKGDGAQIGAPSVAVSGETALILWADRASGEEPWRLRSRRWGRGMESPSPVEGFEISNEDAGTSYISPSVAALEGGRFLVVWTEGTALHHRVRALTLDAAGRAKGAPLAISNDDANAGQGQGAVLPDGRGIVGYLAARGDGFELMAVSIDCPRP